MTRSRTFPVGAAGRAVRAVLVAVLFAGALAAVQLAIPDSAVGCSCAGPGQGAAAFSGGEEAVLVGRIRNPQADGTYELEVERWFRGGTDAFLLVRSEKEVGPDGASAINTCGLHFEVGDHLILSGALAGGTLTPGTCLPHGAVASEEGGRLLAAARAAFGEGRLPGEVERPGEGDEDSGLAPLAIAAVGIPLLVVFIALIASARQRRDADAGA